jgi:hypothetical protein
MLQYYSFVGNLFFNYFCTSDSEYFYDIILYRSHLSERVYLLNHGKYCNTLFYLKKFWVFFSQSEKLFKLFLILQRKNSFEKTNANKQLFFLNHVKKKLMFF